MFLLLSAGIILSTGCNSQPLRPAGEPSRQVLTRGAGEGGELSEVLKLPQPGEELPVSYFGEIWAYLVSGREQALDLDYPITDLVYFGADVDSYGKLIDIPDYKNISSFPGRKHFVAACSGRALTHFVLAEESAERKALIRDLLEEAKHYDGLQIDFENVTARDTEAFHSFLGELRAGLGNKVFSIALAARTRTLREDAYDYARIKPLVDRILVMAYDEHWSTSEPGPIASMNWCRRVAGYAIETIGSEKLIMGLPFYGRSWGSINTNRAYIYSGIEEILQEQSIGEIDREDGIPNFRYETPVSVTVYYEDEYSLSARLGMYKKLGANAVGFWRLGQETPEFWPLIGLDGNNFEEAEK